MKRSSKLTNSTGSICRPFQNFLPQSNRTGYQNGIIKWALPAREVIKGDVASKRMCILCTDPSLNNQKSGKVFGQLESINMHFLKSDVTFTSIIYR